MTRRYLGSIFGNTEPSTSNTNDTNGVYSLSQQNYIRSEGGWQEPYTASGGDVDGTPYSNPDGDYKYHIFKNDGTLTTTGTGTVDILVVAGGGGGGGNDVGAGGGGGGVIMYPNMTLTSGAHAVFVGAGGTGMAHGGSSSGRCGQNSTFGSPVAGADGTTDPNPGANWPATSLIAMGGAQGGHYNGGGSLRGGSSGGNWTSDAGANKGVQGTPGSPISLPTNSTLYGFGNDGGYSLGASGSNYPSGGGGGAGGDGADSGPGGNSGNGGPGKSFPWTPLLPNLTPGLPSGNYGGGGGGGGEFGGGGLGGSGGQPEAGDGNNGSGSNANGNSGQAYSGAGGGGGDGGGGNGGKGLVVVRYSAS